jgi:site-specific DNA recombinase
MQNPINNNRYAEYCRKSSDSEDRQVQSIPDQQKELMPLRIARQANVVKSYGESQSAKKPGRPYFNEMIKLIEEGKIDGIICWKINRLARNPIDGGKIQWLLQTGKLKSILTPGKEYLPTDNVLMMAVELGMANQFILDLSKDVTRGMNTKVQKGWRPVKAPLGYLNDPVGLRGEKRIFKDPERFELVQKMWKLMLTGNYTIRRLRDIITNEWGLRSRQNNNTLSLGGLYRIFTNSFYYGEFTYHGEVFQGKHEPMISKVEFDRVQQVLGRAGKPRPKYKRLPFNGLIQCGECGAMITSDEKIKDIKATGEVRSYIYHHCTKKKKDTLCYQKPIKHEELVKQVNAYLNLITIPEEFLHWTREVLKANNEQEEYDRTLMLENHRKNYDSCLKRIDNLINLYISGDNADKELLTEEEFKNQKNALVAEKGQIEAQMKKIGERVNDWMDLTEKTFEFATYAKSFFEKADYEQKTDILRAFGQNFTLLDGKLDITLAKPFLVLKNGLTEASIQMAMSEPAKLLQPIGKNRPLETVFSHWSG